LAQSIANDTNTLMIVAWGHGGKQGAKPVLHVRGPRLTPEDFAQLVDRRAASRGMPSRMVLLFRGSGAFARRLAGSDRFVLSSDHETAFRSDPVGMSLLLKLVREHPGDSFEQVAKKLGLATAAWYAERNLARTEEPTLWPGEEKPLLLALQHAGGTGETAATEHGTSKEHPPAGDVPARSRPAEGAATADPPASWAGIQTVDPKAYPGADGVILRQTLQCSIGGTPVVVTEHDQFIQVLTPEGKRLGDLDVSYAPPEEEVEFLDCEVRRPDGTFARLNPDAVVEAGERAVADFQFGRRKYFSLPGVEPGAVLRVRYRSQWKRFPLPQVSMEFPIREALPILHSAVQVRIPKEVPFHFAFEEMTAPDPVIEQSGYGTTYRWSFRGLPAWRSEVLAAPRQPQLRFSTFRDWAAFAEWYGRIARMADTLTPELETHAKALTRQAKTDRDKVIALYHYVVAMRYVAVPLGVNSLRPHAAQNVFRNQFGDCKDKANLFNTLLRAVDIPADLVLVPRFGQANENVPGMSFNHAISRVTLGNETLWIDTTDEVCRFGMLPPGDSGRKVLVIDGRSQSLDQLPDNKPEDHRLVIRGKVHGNPFSEGLRANLTATSTGYPDYELRNTAREAKEDLAALPLLASRFRPAAGSFALASQRASPVSALDQDFTWQAEGEMVGLMSASGRKRLIHSPFWLPKEWDLALNRRQAPLFLHAGYPLTLEQEFTFELPPESRTEECPRPCGQEEGPLRWRVEWARERSHQLVARLKAQLARGDLSAAETQAFQQQLRALWSAISIPVVVSVTSDS
jgi:hypothetical protein